MVGIRSAFIQQSIRVTWSRALAVIFITSGFGACSAIAVVLLKPENLRETSSPQISMRLLAPGITYRQEIYFAPAPRIVNALTVNLDTQGVTVRCGQAHGKIALEGPLLGREAVGTIANQARALAAVNADYFPFTGGPVGLAIQDGELYRDALGFRACLEISASGPKIDRVRSIGIVGTETGPSLQINGLNRMPGADETILVTPMFSSSVVLKNAALIISLKSVDLPLQVSRTTRGTVDTVTPLEVGSRLPNCMPGHALFVATGTAVAQWNGICEPGERLHIRFDLYAASIADKPNRLNADGTALSTSMGEAVWKDAEQAVSGGPWLLRNGEIAIDAEQEKFPKASFVEARHARTAVGIQPDGRLLFVTVDGKQAISGGVTLLELAGIMKHLGAKDAMNLDGGGSTTMTVHGSIVNGPSDGHVRPVANALLIFGAPKLMADSGNLSIVADSPIGVPLRIGQIVRFKMARSDGKSLAARQIVWGTKNGAGFISQEGIFTATHAGNDTINAWVGSNACKVLVTVGPALQAPIVPEP